MMLFYYCLCRLKGENFLPYLKLYSQYLTQFLSTGMLKSILELIHVHNSIPKTLLQQLKYF